MAVPVIDLFAGPGGLNEGFSATGGAFRTVASFEMDPIACRTLQLRSALRLANGAAGFPDEYYAFLRGRISWDQLTTGRLREEWAEAAREVHNIELGSHTRAISDQLISESLARAGVGDREPWVLIGGPPCQAYSLVGRARRAHDEKFALDKKHFLYREYLSIVHTFKPAIFVMENVKGLLSHVHSERRMFDRMLEDLSGDGTYEIRSFVTDDPAPRPSDFIIRSEDHGVPQRRHRVILLGIRRGFGFGQHVPLAPRDEQVSVGSVIKGMPRVRSEIWPLSGDSPEIWKAVRAAGLRDYHGERAPSPSAARTHTGFHTKAPVDSAMPQHLREWLLDDRIGGVVQHEPRRHMVADLRRYAYLAAAAKDLGRTPRVSELPAKLLPEHRNVRGSTAGATVPFADRFNVQVWGRPASTIVSHLAKDGHHFIHPDPSQMRSLTVREAARLQTFPDNYWFAGPRTKQFQQVGNAVPPLLARQLAQTVAELLAHADSGPTECVA